MPEVIVALDVASREEALETVGLLGPSATFYKVGLELFSSAGPDAVRDLVAQEKRIFLDLKLHDIPHTVAAAVRAAADLGAELLTVHAGGGRAMMEAAAGAAREGLRLLGVTVLTSLSASELEEVRGGGLQSLRDEVLRLGGLVRDAGLDGVVASAREAEPLKRRFGRAFLVATPGIRLEGGAVHDQARVATPADAVRAGADFLVVGRAVTGAQDPRAALKAVLRSVEDAGDPVVAP